MTEPPRAGEHQSAGGERQSAGGERQSAGSEPAGSPPATPEPEPLSRLDPERAGGGPAADPPRSPPPVIDTRRYRWMIGIFGLALVVAISIYQFATHGLGTTGVPPGHRLHYFAAPLADTNLMGDPNLNPPCTLAKHDRRALNVCLDVKRAPLVLAFFVTGSDQCRRSVDALQTLSRSGAFPRRSVQFAAVGVEASRSDTVALVRSHHWTIPVAYDRDGSIGSLYGVAVCPMLELAYRGGIVRDRLIGGQWQSAAALAPRVRALVRARRPSS